MWQWQKSYAFKINELCNEGGCYGSYPSFPFCRAAQEWIQVQMKLLNALPLTCGDLDLALSHQNFNPKYHTMTTRNVTFKISVNADSSNINFIFPLLDNLFKPKERFIPEKEMHMRSKRYKLLQSSLQITAISHLRQHISTSSSYAGEWFCHTACHAFV